MHRTTLLFCRRASQHLRSGALVLIAIAFLLAVAVFAQVGKIAGRDIKIPAETFDPPNQDRVKTYITAKQAHPAGNNEYFAELLKIETFGKTGDAPEMIMEAPNCNFDMKTHAAHSAGPLQIHSADEKMRIAGTGFLWEKVGTNSILTISNQVHATIQREMLAANTAGGTATNAPGTNQFVQIYSDTFAFDRDANLITFAGHVRGENTQMELQCDLMTIRRPTNRVDQIDADRNVVIVTRETGGRATGDHAVYAATEQLLKLTGNPHYQDGEKEATGQIFYFDQVHRTMQAEGDAHFKMPRNSLGQGGLLAAPQTAPKTAAPGAINLFAEIYADSLWLQLPPTTGAVQRVTASNHVIILDPEKNSHASAGHADYVEATGLLELTGHALWQADQRVAKAEVLTFNRNDQSFAARTNAYLRFPTASLGTNQFAMNAAGTTNQFIEVVASDYEYGAGTLTFHEQVQAGMVQGESIRGTLEAGTLTVSFTTNNQVQSIHAETDVYGRSLPATNEVGTVVERDLRCQSLDVKVRTNSLIQEVVAQRNVRASQTEVRTNSPLPVHLSLNADLVRAVFFPNTNQIETGLAEGNVVLTKDDTTALGNRLVYSGINDVARLLGDPMLARPGVTSTQDQILFDHAKGTFVFGDTGKVQIRINVAKAKAGATNAPAPPVKAAGKTSP